MTRALYLVGDSRSGSTILGAVLGSDPRMVATGELSLLLLDDRGEPRRCSCGLGVAKCPFWSVVTAAWQRFLPSAGAAAYLDLQRRYERFRDVPRLGRSTRGPGSPFAAYAAWTADLFEGIAQTARAELVVDGSKNPIRGWALLRAGDPALLLLHVVRDPRAVIWSKLRHLRWKPGPKSLQSPPPLMLRSVLDWLLVNGTAEWVASSHGEVPYRRLRYEDFAGQPAATLQGLGSFLGLDLSSIAGLASRGEAFAYGHIMAGNRARFEGPAPLTLDEAWKETMPKRLRQWVWRLTVPLARRYGYVA